MCTKFVFTNHDFTILLHRMDSFPCKENYDMIRLTDLSLFIGKGPYVII